MDGYVEKVHRPDRRRRRPRGRRGLHADRRTCATLVGARVRVTLEIEAEIPDGVPENVVRVVTENSRTLKFESHGFEDE